MDLREIYSAAVAKDISRLIESIFDFQKTTHPSKIIFKVILDDYLNMTFTPSQFVECVIEVLKDNPEAAGQRAPQDVPPPSSGKLNPC